MASVARRTTYIWCPTCRKKVLQKSDDGAVRIRTRILVFRSPVDAMVVCQHCGHEVPVDISLGKSTDADVRAPKMVLRDK